MTVVDYNQAVDSYADNLYRFLLKKTNDTYLAKDLVQECFEKVWLKHREIEFDKVKSYMFSVAFHLFIDHTRRSKKWGEYNEKQEAQKSHNTSYTGLNDVIDEALKKLPDVQKTVLLLRDYEGYDYAEIGEITNLSESQVKVYIFRARKAMKDYLVSLDVVL